MATATSKTKAPAKAPAKSTQTAKAAAPTKAAAPAKVKAPAKLAKPAPAKAAAKPAKAAAPKAAAKPKADKPAAKSAGKRAAVAPDQRRFYIEVAAYYIAERRGFHGGSQLADWAQAEKEIEQLLAEGRING